VAVPLEVHQARQTLYCDPSNANSRDKSMADDDRHCQRSRGRWRGDVANIQLDAMQIAAQPSKFLRESMKS
jgi:hypothetical protein